MSSFAEKRGDGEEGGFFPLLFFLHPLPHSLAPLLYLPPPPLRGDQRKVGESSARLSDSACYKLLQGLASSSTTGFPVCSDAPCRRPISMTTDRSRTPPMQEVCLEACSVETHRRPELKVTQQNNVPSAQCARAGLRAYVCPSYGVCVIFLLMRFI